MSEGYIDLSPILNAVSRVDGRITTVSNQVYETQSMVQTAVTELEELKNRFEYMIQEQKKSAAYQRALTEIVRIRQELDKKFGKQQKVRDNMLGILQASDLSLVKEKTISQCSEELMLACPRYWLAPCLIAITAWMANDKSLATRALDEAIKRNDESTSLVMALVSRRAGKVNASFVWLQRYFNMQNPNNMKESILAYIDAYANGIFGDDEYDRCSQSVDRWMADLSEQGDFKTTQVNNWKQRFDAIKEKRLSDVTVLEANGVCPEYPRIFNYVSRIRNQSKIYGIFDYIMSRHIDKKKLIETIDENLETLVSQYEEEEAPLRREEHEMSLLKECKGDEEKVQAILASEVKEDLEVNLADRLSQAIVDGTTPPSIRKTSVVLMSSFIKEAYKEYMTETAQYYPEEITLNLGGVQFKTKNGENKQDMQTKLKQKNEEMRQVELSGVGKGGIILWGILSITIIGIFGLIHAIKKRKNKINAINTKYDQRDVNVNKLLETALKERATLNQEVYAFEQLENRDVLEIPAAEDIKL